MKGTFNRMYINFASQLMKLLPFSVSYLQGELFPKGALAGFLDVQPVVVGPYSFSSFQWLIFIYWQLPYPHWCFLIQLIQQFDCASVTDFKPRSVKWSI